MGPISITSSMIFSLPESEGWISFLRSFSLSWSSFLASQWALLLRSKVLPWHYSKVSFKCFSFSTARLRARTVLCTFRIVLKSSAFSVEIFASWSIFLRRFVLLEQHMELKTNTFRKVPWRIFSGQLRGKRVMHNWPFAKALLESFCLSMTLKCLSSIMIVSGSVEKTKRKNKPSKKTDSYKPPASPKKSSTPYVRLFWMTFLLLRKNRMLATWFSHSSSVTSLVTSSNLSMFRKVVT